MDPQLPESFNHKSDNLSTGRTYHFVDQLPANYDPKLNVTLLCIHGFPDLWYGWRYQIGPWVRQGARVIAPDMLGYGGTSKPVEAEEYSTKKLCADLAALLNISGVEKAVIIGHDWGAYTAGRFALWYPDRVIALIMMSVPFSPPSREYIPVEEVARRAPNLGYQVYFASPKSSVEVLSHLEKFLRLTMRKPEVNLDYTSLGSLEKLLKDPSPVPSDIQSVLNEKTKEFQYYLSQFRNGIFGPLNYYRTSKFRHDEELAHGLPANLRSDLPFLFIWGTKDTTATPFVIKNSKKFVSRYQDLALEGRGHWVLIEAKEEITEKVVKWLRGLTSSNYEGKL